MNALSGLATGVLTGLVAWGLAGSAAQAQQRPAITGIAFARMYSSNPPGADLFYAMLGFPAEPEIKGPQGSDQFLQRYDVTDSQWLEVVPLPDPAPPARLAAVGFTTRNAAALEKYLSGHGVQVVEPLKHGQFMVLDPEGNHVAFVQEGSHKISAPNRDGVGEQTSHRIIHVGYAVKDAAAEDHFYKELLGFKDYWHGGMTDARTDFISIQVPDGTDWLEYMLNSPHYDDPKAQLRQMGVLDHFSLGVAHMQDVVDELARNGCATTSQAANCKKTQMGRDGKVQLNVLDPDQTRVEYMEFKPSGTVCCSPFVGKHPTDVEDK
jgi:catechol 2,3-dioxygenase-like lactoylglutathione lyase family enzyme